MTTTMNLDELKAISRLALLHEITEKTKSCALTWLQIGPSQYFCSQLPYDFYLTKTGQTAYSLDVHKNSQFYRTFHSYTQSEVQDLYETIDALIAKSEQADKARNIMSFITQIPNCIQPRVYSNLGHGGIYANGRADCFSGIVLAPNGISAALTNAAPDDPNLLTNPIASGSYTDIDEPVNSHDSDATRVVINSGIATNPSYIRVKITFNQALVPASAEFDAIRYRVVGRISDAADLVNSVLSYSVNQPTGPFTDSAAGFADMVGTYVVYDSGFVNLPTTMLGSEFTAPLCLWFDVAPVTTIIGSQKKFYLTAADLSLAKA